MVVPTVAAMTARRSCFDASSALRGARCPGVSVAMGSPYPLLGHLTRVSRCSSRAQLPHGSAHAAGVLHWARVLLEALAQLGELFFIGQELAVVVDHLAGEHRFPPIGRPH